MRKLVRLAVPLGVLICIGSIAHGRTQEYKTRIGKTVTLSPARDFRS